MSASEVMGTTPQEEEPNNEPVPSSQRQPLAHVLNIAINHVMAPPSPLEPEEFQAANKHKNKNKQDNHDPKKTATQPLVPILRVFGPILRGDIPDNNHKDPIPVQTACLYIHGAFPYLLARPVVAGPDGSCHRSSHWMDSLTPSGHVNWDSYQAVQEIASLVQETLESELQKSVIRSTAVGNHSEEDESSNQQQKRQSYDNKQTAATSSIKFIRRVAVVMGRGFYTFCPGPTAPFLRVEYYDPGERWKIKKTLERGLELSRKYHPDPQQYDAVGKEPSIDSSQSGLSEPLKFHCYEAHIPYTMQFFKDFNLAGKKKKSPFESVCLRLYSYILVTFLFRYVPYSSCWRKVPAETARQSEAAMGATRRYLWRP